jgi:phage terminase Nu1 subunit (DNA packaging protein)
MTRAELARDLGVSEPYVAKLVDQGLVILKRDGTVDERRTLANLYLYWCPRDAWWDKPVGALGHELRRKWAAEAAEHS